MRKGIWVKYLLLFQMAAYAVVGCSPATVSEIQDSRTAEEADSEEGISQDSLKVGMEDFLEYTETAEEIQIELTEEICNDMESVSYAVIGQDEEGYYLVLEGEKIEADENNIVHIPKNKRVPVLYFEETGETLELTRLKEQQKDGMTEWYTQYFAFFDVDRIHEICYMHLNIMDTDAEGDLEYTMSPRLLSGTSNPLTEMAAMKYWDNVHVSAAYADEIRDSAGTAVPATDGTYDKFIYYEYGYNGKKDGLHFQTRFLDELPGTYYCQLIIERSGEKREASEYIPMQNHDGSPFEITEKSEVLESVQMDTEKGSMSFDVYDGYAVLTKYSGEDAALSIPDDINGVPVTTIGERAFEYNTVLRDIKFPTDLKVIKAFAFYVTNLEKLELPDSLEYIGTGAFSRYFPADSTEESAVIETLNLGKNVAWIGDNAFNGYYIKNYMVHSDNPYFMSEDGVIYTKDQSFLLACPTGKSGDFQIPEGVTSVSEYAFKFNGSYDNVAENEGITSLILADSVKAFSGVELPYKLKELRIGAGLEEWEYMEKCFQLPELNVVISEKNKYFRQDETIIYKDQGRELNFYAAENEASEFTIPETVTKIDDSAFGSNSYLREINIPADLELTDMEYWEISRVFCNIENLLSFNVEEGSRFFSSVDGVLFSADQLVLLCYPKGKTEQQYTVPEGVTAISMEAFDGNSVIEKLSLPSTLKELKLSEESNIFLSVLWKLKEVSVSKDNPYFKSEDSFLFLKKEKELVYAPVTTESSVMNLPEEIITIKKNVFSLYSNCEINEIHIPEGVTTIEGNNFSYISNSDQWDMVHIYLPDSLETVAADSFQDSPGVIIHAHAGSYAQRFAEENQITFEAVEE